MTSNILIVDDEAGSRESLVDVLNDEGYGTAAAADGSEAIALIEANDFDLVITDLRMPGLDGVALLKQIRQLRPQTLVILMTAYASVETAVDALREGAHDYMIKPLVFEDALAKIARLLERRQLAWQIQHLRHEVEERFDFDNLVGQSAAMKKIVGLIKKVAPTDSTVLITGESGVGKEVVARAVHRQSNRAERIFLPVNCGAIPENLLESQLFGHVRGAFTGAVTSQEGLFQRAKNGTIFLDEIGELPLGLQVKLLRVLEEKEVLAVGATESNHVDIRIVAATNRNLEESCNAGEFREDLFYRLNVFGIDIPPLRGRREDIPLLVDFLVRRHNKEMNRHFKGVENSAMKILVAAPWKGNVRELDNIIEHAMILGSGDWITADDLPNRVAATGAGNGFDPMADLKSATRMFERNHIENVLTEAEGDKRAAASKLGISLSSLYRKIEELGITVS
jgi:two-component system response regulator PilR (NtrC family)